MKILVCDEQKMFFQTVQQLIQESEWSDCCSLFWVQNEEQWSGLLAQVLPDLCFMNVEFAGGRGIACVEGLHRNRRRMGVVFTADTWEYATVVYRVPHLS